MKRWRFSARGQSISEYVVLLVIVAIAFIAMQVYFKRGLQGRIRDLSNQISATHFESGRTNSQYTTRQVGRSETLYDNGIATSTIPQEWRDAEDVKRQGIEVRRWGHETTFPQEQP